MHQVMLSNIKLSNCRFSAWQMFFGKLLLSDNDLHTNFNSIFCRIFYNTFGQGGFSLPSFQSYTIRVSCHKPTFFNKFAVCLSFGVGENEQAALATGSEIEESQVLIPSLTKFTNTTIQQHTVTLSNFRNFLEISLKLLFSRFKLIRIFLLISGQVDQTAAKSSA